MLGEMIGEASGKRSVRRVLSSQPLKVEVSFEDAGKVFGLDYQGFGTYIAEAQPDGMLIGHGEGVAITGDGEMVAWRGDAKGQIKPGGTVSYRGILFYQTASQKLAKLNRVGGVFEFESSPDGSTHSKVWEWK